jgi:hypothetical protein
VWTLLFALLWTGRSGASEWSTGGLGYAPGGFEPPPWGWTEPLGDSWFAWRGKVEWF